jgi:DNA-binding beta-propeller fold protein YncE
MITRFRRAALAMTGVWLTGCLSSTNPGPGEDDSLLPREPLFLRDTIIIGSRPYGVAVAGNTALVTQLDAAAVQRFTLPSRTPQAIAVGQVPTGIAINAAGTRALVTNQHDLNVGILDVAAAQQTKTIDAGATTFRVVFAAGADRAYATNSAGFLFAVDPVSGVLVDTATTVHAANGLALVGDTLLLVTSMGGDVAYVDARTLVETRRLGVDGVLQDVVARGSANRFYLANESRAVIEVRALDTGELLHSIVVPEKTFGLTRRPRSPELWAAHPGITGNGGISVIDLVSLSVVRTIPLADPRRIAFDANGDHGVVSDQSGAVYFLRP